ncbi:BamA/TamA family outer membrane protein [Paraliomyxa miuraensis]|nr:BamA/TamA family outer membrane protein [Paraliomyxa miuraensis]
MLDEVDLTDPLGPVEAVLEDLSTRPGITVIDRARTVDRLRGETLTARLHGVDGALLQYMLERIAEDGYQILLEPVGERAFLLIALRSRPGQGRGVLLVGVESLEIEGTPRSGESTEMLSKLLVLPAGGVLPVGITEQLAAVGYRAALQASGSGEITVQVSPGRSIRRVRVYGNLPLSTREVRRVLSPQARPGSLAPGRCAPPNELGRRPKEVVPGDSGRRGGREQRAAAVDAPYHSRICEEDDLACREWERTELQRLERFLFDEGYLDGRAALGFACGRSDEEVDLYVTLRKGQSYRVGAMKITGNLSTQDQRWIRRVFRPTVSPFIPIPRRITRKHIEKTKERVAREYAEPRVGAGSGARRQLKYPYPGVRIDTDFDRLDPDTLPPGRKLPLTIDVQLGQGVKTEFLFNEHITDNRLRSQLQLFQRREPANASAAQREAAHLRGFYQSRGFMLATVEGKFDDFGSLPTLRFTVREGPRVTVRSAQLVLPVFQATGVEDEDPIEKLVQRAYERRRKLEPRASFTDAHAREDLGLILSTLNEAGYLCARATMRVAFWPEGLERQGQHAVFDSFTELDTQGSPQWLEGQLDAEGLAALRQQRRAGVYVRIDVVPGPRVITSAREDVRYLEQPIPGSRETQGLPVLDHGAWGKPLMLRGSPLRRDRDESAGDIPVDLTLDREVERDIVRRYRASGYPLADVELRWRYTDARGNVHRVAQAERLATPELGLCQEHARAAEALVDTELAVYEGRPGRFGTTLLRGNFKTRRKVLLRQKTWEETDPYDRREVDETRRNIEGLGVTEAVQVREIEVGCHLDDDEDQCVVHHVVSVTESKDRSIDVTGGIGGATLDPLYVFLRPTLPNMLGSAWDLQLDGHYGFGNVLGTFCGDENCYERSGRASLLRRRIFAKPLTFELTGQIQRRLTPARGQIDSALAQARFTWPVGEHWRMYAGYLVQIANISKDVSKPVLGVEDGCAYEGSDSKLCRLTNRSEAIVPDRTGGLQAGAVWQKVDNAFNPDKGFILTLDWLFATPFPGLGREWWLRGDVGWQQFVPIPRTDSRLNFRYSLRYGHALPLPQLPGSTGATSVPEIWRYFGGGTIDLGIRGIEPQTMLVDVERIPGSFGTARLSPTAQGGHIRALGTVALQVVSIQNFLGGKLAHSAFVDLGVLTQKWSQVKLGRDLRRSVGINFVKWDIRIVTVSVGYAVLVPDWIWPGGNVGPTDDRDGRFVFDVGATF